jgi:SOS-response transcriptional repressor LexA
MSALTAKQKQLLDFLKHYSARHERMPSFDEMRIGLGLRSKSGVHRLINALEERGFIRRIINRARAIEIVDSPHLPSTDLRVADVGELVGEMKRRGFVIGYYRREQFTGIKGEAHSYKRFVEVAA